MERPARRSVSARSKAAVEKFEAGGLLPASLLLGAMRAGQTREAEYAIPRVGKFDRAKNPDMNVF